MNTALTKTEQNRKQLATVLQQNKSYVYSVIPIEKEQDFQTNFLELAQNNYLMEKIPPKEILITALNATKLGLNVNPIYKEIYVLPFNVKGRGMVASIVIPKQGHIQMAFDAGFFLKIDLVFNLNGTIVTESNMTMEQKIQIDTTNSKWVDEHLVGWEITLDDISNNEIKVPTQTKFIEVNYAKEVTKELQMPQYKIQTWTHKAVRRAMGDMFIPKHRKNMMLEYVEAFNVQNEQKKIEENATPNVNEAQKPVDLKAQAEVEESLFGVTVSDIMDFYMEADNDKKARISEVMVIKNDWREYDSVKLGQLMEEIKAL